MRKNKTWEVGFDGTTNQLDDDVFFSNDTDAYLTFRPTNSELEFTSADVILLNKDDGSLVQREMTKVDGGAEYEIEPDIMIHFGLWQVQAIFKKDGEVATNVPVTFSIDRYMMHEKQPSLTEYQSVSEFLARHQLSFTQLFNESETAKDNFVTVANQKLSEFETASSAAITNINNNLVQLNNAYDELVEDGILQENIAEKLDDFVESQAPELANLSAQLAQKVDKGNVSVSDINKNLGKLDQTYMTEEFMQQIAGTTPINAIPAQESITTDMIADTIKPKNLFNSALQLGALTSAGVPTVNENLIVTTNFIYVEENTTYTVKNSNNYPVRIAFYNSEDNFISYIQFEDTFTTPANTRKLKLSTFQANGHNDLNTLFMLNEGSTALPYEPYVSPKIKQKYIEPISEIPDDSVGTESLQDGAVTITKTDFFEQGKNIFDKSKVIEGYYVNQVSGVLQANSAHKASSPMQVEAGATYVSAQPLQRYAVYNGETFVSGGLNAFTVTIPIGANRLVVSSDSFDIDTLQIEKGTVATDYEPYGYKVKDELLPTSYGDGGNQFISDGAKKYRIVGANIRTPLAAGLPFTLLDDAGHEPMGITSATIVGDGLRIGMPFTAKKVISMSATPHVSMRNEGWEVATTGGLSVHEVHFYKNGVHVPASEVVQNGGSFWYSGVFLV